MQYHLNGFQPGDPDQCEVSPQRFDSMGALPDCVDVLIIGCGPAGLTLAAQLSHFPEISTRIIEQKSGPLIKGQADGISCRSMEMFNAFGFADTIIRQGYQVSETTFWKPDPNQPERIVRNGRVQDVEDGLSEMPHMILNQARVHDMYLRVMKQSPSRLEPDYGWQCLDLFVNDRGEDYPVTVRLKNTAESGGDGIRTIRARYVVGCDGARSQVRQSIGRNLTGESANQAWGVMDVLAVTDFPDIRYKSLIKSDRDGSLLIIPREGGYLVRLYIELDKLGVDERVADRQITIDKLVARAQLIIQPYHLDVKDVVWWSVYEIGQRMTDRFDDVSESDMAELFPRVFIAGDACHTHSPKAGQGMNVSMGDAFNLGWKLVSVLQGRCSHEILHSYSAERLAVARDLITFDSEWARIMSERAEKAEGEDAPKFQKYFIEHGRYTAGMSVQYKPSVLTGEGTWQHLAPGFEIGKRFHSAPVIRLADARALELGHVITADTRWRLFVFCKDEDYQAKSSALNQLCTFLADSPASPVRSYNRAGEDIDALFDVRAIFPQYFRDLDLETLPLFLLPRKGIYGLIDYEKLFCAHREESPDIFDLRGIDRRQGCLVIVRPDQYIADIFPLDAYDQLATFFGGFMLPCENQS